MGASDYFVGAAPQGASYAAPLIGFQLGQAIGNLPKDYFDATQRARQLAMQNAFPNGLPMKDGRVDVNAMANTGAKLGGLEYGEKLLPYLYGDQSGQSMQDLDSWVRGGGTGAPAGGPANANMGPAATPSAAGPANLRMGQGGGAPQAQPQAPQPQPQPQPQLSSAGTDNNGSDTIRSVATEAFGGRDVSPMIPRFAAALGVSSDAPLTAEQVTRARAIMGRTAQASGGAQQPQASAPNLADTTGGGAPVTALGGASGAPAPQAAQAPQAQPPQVAAPKPGEVGAAGVPFSEYPTAMERLARASALSNAAAARAGRFNPQAAAAMSKQAELYDTRRKQMYEELAQRGQLTPEVKNALASGSGSPLDYENKKARGSAEAKNTELTTEQKNAGVAGAPFAPAGGNASVNPVLDFQRKQEEQKSDIARGEKQLGGIQAQASQYERDLKPYLTLSRSILNDPQMYTGLGAEATLNWDKVKAYFGDNKAAMLKEALSKVTATSVLSQINTQRDQLQEAGGASSRIFSAQVDLVEKAAPALQNTLGGNRFLVEVSGRMGELSSRVAQMARDYKQAHGHLDVGFDNEIARYMEANPIFSKNELAHPELIGAPTSPFDDVKRTAAWAHKMGLGPNDPIRTPSGRYIPVSALTPQRGQAAPAAPQAAPAQGG
jgi:hypothetical protein